MTTDEALIKLTESTAGAVAGVLEVLCPGAVECGSPTIVAKGADPLGGMPKVRVWAELGRSRLPVGRAVGLAPGAIVELDREVDAPVDVFVNGHRFALGRLLIADGDWAVRIERILDAASPSPDVARGARVIHSS